MGYVNKSTGRARGERALGSRKKRPPLHMRVTAHDAEKSSQMTCSLTRSRPYLTQGAEPRSGDAPETLPSTATVQIAPLPRRRLFARLFVRASLPRVIRNVTREGGMMYYYTHPKHS